MTHRLLAVALFGLSMLTGCPQNRKRTMEQNNELAARLAEAYDHEDYDLSFVVASRVIKNSYEEHSLFEDEIAEELVKEFVDERITLLHSLDPPERKEALRTDDVTSGLLELSSRAFLRAKRLLDKKPFVEDTKFAGKDNEILADLSARLKSLGDEDLTESCSDLISETQLDITYVVSDGEGPKSLRLAKEESMTE